MQKSTKFITISLAASAILIGLGMYFNRRHASAPGPASDLHSVTVPATNRPIMHARPPSAAAETADETSQTNSTTLPREKVEEYLRRHNRNAASLLAAFHALNDTNYLNEAATNFPNDPHLQWTILARDAFPADRRKWLDGFKSSSPSNSLANYLSARDYLKNNQPDAAVKELLTASSKSQFNDYSTETILDAEELGQFSGSLPMMTHIASMAAVESDNLPVMADFKGIATGIRDLQQQYLNSGDASSAQSLAQAGVGLADRLTEGDGGKFLINQLVGIGSENIVLQALDQNASYDFLGGETPAQRLAELKQQKAAIRDLTTVSSTIPTLSEAEQASYWERSRIYGELEALRWVQQQNATTPSSGN
jgi:hypothetical protein